VDNIEIENNIKRFCKIWN